MENIINWNNELVEKWADFLSRYFDAYICITAVLLTIMFIEVCYSKKLQNYAAVYFIAWVGVTILEFILECYVIEIPARMVISLGATIGSLIAWFSSPFVLFIMNLIRKKLGMDTFE